MQEVWVKSHEPYIEGKETDTKVRRLHNSIYIKLKNI